MSSSTVSKLVLLGCASLLVAAQQETYESCVAAEEDRFETAVDAVLPAWYKRCAAIEDYTQVEACFNKEMTPQRATELTRLVDGVAPVDFTACEGLPAEWDYECTDRVYSAYTEAVARVTPSWANQCEMFDFDCVESKAPNAQQIQNYYNAIERIPAPNFDACYNQL